MKKMQNLPHANNLPGNKINETRHKKDLNILLFSVMVICGLSALASMGIYLVEPILYNELALNEILLTSILVLFASLILFFLNRYGSNLLASVIFNLVIFLGVIIADTPEKILYGRSFFYLVIPLITSAVLIHPWAGYVVAGLITIGSLIISKILAMGIPDPLALGCLFLIAFVIQQVLSNTDRMVAQELRKSHSLFESQDRYQKITESSPNAIMIVDLAGKIIECNDAAGQMYGATSKQEFLGLNALEIAHPDSKALVSEISGNLLKYGQWSASNFKFLQKDGSTRFSDFYATLLTDWEGKPTSFVFTIQDITERKEAEDALRESEEKFSRAFHFTPMPMAISNLEGRYVEINQAYMRTFEYQREELIDRKLADVGIIVYPEQFEQAVHMRREQGSLENFVMNLRTHSGDILDMAVYSTPLQLNDRSLILTLLDNITERKKMENALRVSEENYRRLVETLPIGLLVHQGGPIRLINPTGAKILGAENPETIIGTRNLDYVHPDYLELVQDRVKATLVDRKLTDLVHEKLIRTDGRTIDVEVVGQPINFNGQPSMLVMFQDISERLQAEQAIEIQNRRIQEVSRQLMNVQEHEKRLLASELHDDLGQSLTSLKLTLDLASRTRSAVKRDAIMEDAHGFVSELMGKVRNLSLDLRPAMLDDFGLLATLRWLFKRYQDRTGISIDFTCNLSSEQRFPPHTEIAAFRIIQEALTNIARHSGVKQAQVNINFMDENLSIEITDKGAGFNFMQDHQEMIGSSGLSGMQERARLLGGQLKIQSEKGIGTRVIAEIPLTGGPS